MDKSFVEMVEERYGERLESYLRENARGKEFCFGGDESFKDSVEEVAAYLLESD